MKFQSSSPLKKFREDNEVITVMRTHLFTKLFVMVDLFDKLQPRNLEIVFQIIFDVSFQKILNITRFFASIPKLKNYFVHLYNEINWYN